MEIKNLLEGSNQSYKNMQEDSANDLKMLQEWFEPNRIRETGIVENVQKQPASPERDEMLEICKGNIEEFTMMLSLIHI